MTGIVLRVLLLAVSQNGFASIEPAQEPPVRSRWTSLGLTGRVAFPGGEVTDSGIGYGDLFHSGPGFGIQGDRVYSVDPALSLGGYAAFGFDRFEGDRFVDEVGDTLRPDTLDEFSLLAGGKILFRFDEPVFSGNWLLLDLRVGGGIVHYRPVEATVVIGGLTTKGMELFEGTTAPAFEASLRTGVSGETLSFYVGLGVRIFGGPGRGRDMSWLVDPGAMTQVVLEIGYEMQF